MDGKNKDEILHDYNNDGVDRWGFLRCMGWNCSLCVIQGGVLKSYSLSQASKMEARRQRAS
jgi:hypothetical protein